MRNRARNRKQQEKEAELNVAFYAEDGAFAAILGMEGEAAGHGLLGGDLRSRPATPAELSPALLEHRKRTPLCYFDPCNDPACRLDHEGREIQVFDGDLSRYWER